MKKLFVFDLDGTLADTRADLAAAVSKALMQNNFPPLSEPEVAVRVGDGARQLIEKCLRAVLKQTPADHQVDIVLQDFLKAYFAAPMVHTTGYSFAENFLSQLVRRPDIMLAVLTNKPMAPAETILKGLGLREYFGLVIGGDSGFGLKPEPNGLRHLIDAHHATPASTILIGDGWQDCEAAKRLNVPFIAHLSGMGSAEELHLRGFRYGFHDYSEFATKLPVWEKDLFPFFESAANLS